MVTVFSYGYGNGPEWSEQVGVWTWMPSILATQLWSSVAQRMVTFKNSIVLQTKKRSWEKNQESSSGHQDWQKGTRHQRSKEIIDGPSPSNVLYHFFYCNHRIGGKSKEFDENIYIYMLEHKPVSMLTRFVFELFWNTRRWYNSVQFQFFVSHPSQIEPSIWTQVKSIWHHMLWEYSTC